MGDHKTKVVFVLGTTGAGKTKLSLDVASRFGGEIINSDKIQVYEGMDLATNKVPEVERRGIPHHLLGHILDPEADYTVEDFAHDALSALDKIAKAGSVPIIVGGSNSYIEELVENPVYGFKERFEPCFLWIKVAMPVLHAYVAERIDVMADRGLVEELRQFHVPGSDYTRGIHRAIGAPEFDRYFKEAPNLDEENKERLLRESVQEMKDNTCKLTLSQLTKLGRLRNQLGWRMNTIDATSVFAKSGQQEAEAEWDQVVAPPAFKLVEDFLHRSVNVADNAVLYEGTDHAITGRNVIDVVEGTAMDETSRAAAASRSRNYRMQ